MNAAPVALVTGGLTGIGAGVSRAFLAAGYAVTATALTRGEVEAGQRELAHPRLTALALDVRERAAVVALGSGFEALHALVNCAGMALGSPAEQTEDGFCTVVDVNLNGTQRMCAAAFPALERAAGSVVNVASVLSFFGSANAPAYAASKGGVVQLTRSLAIAWAARGVRVNAVAPGWITTALTRPVREAPGRSDAILARTPMQRWGTPDDIAGVVLFLCSPAARFMTGAVLPVDGGYTAM